MKRQIQASQVVSARTSDTGDGIRLVMLDENGEEMVVVLPLDQLALLSSWLEAAGRMTESESPHPPSPPLAVEKWSVRPEADEEHIHLGFKLPKGGEINFTMHRHGAAALVKAMGSLLGRLLPAPPSRTKH